MDLRNGQITVSEVLSNPRARTLVQREFPGMLNNPMLGMARNMPLNRVIQMARGKVPQARINALLNQLKAV